MNHNAAGFVWTGSLYLPCGYYCLYVVAAISLSLCVMHFFVPYVNVFLSHSACFSLLASHLHFVPYIFVLVFHVHLVLVYRPYSRFPEPDFQHLVSRLLYRLFVFSF